MGPEDVLPGTLKLLYSPAVWTTYFDVTLGAILIQTYTSYIASPSKEKQLLLWSLQEY